MLARDIHSIVIATQGENGDPVTCVIDMMDSDETGLYYLTARGKSFYERLKAHPMLALTGFKGTDTMHTTAISLTGEAKELGADLLPRLFSLNPYMAGIYPSEVSRSILTVQDVSRLSSIHHIASIVGAVLRSARSWQFIVAEKGANHARVQFAMGAAAAAE